MLGTLLGHTDRVNCLRWLPAAAFFGAAAAASAPLVLASGAGDGTVRVWLWTPHTPAQPWRLAATLQGHTAPVTSLTAFSLATTSSGGDGGQGMLLVSTAGDGEVHVWQCSPGGDSSSSSSGSGGLADPASWHLRQRIEVGHQLQDCTAVAALPGTPGWLLLAAGGVDGAVRLYTCPPGGHFQLACKLAGHQDWVRGLAFTQLDGEAWCAAAAGPTAGALVSRLPAPCPAHVVAEEARLPAAGLLRCLLAYVPASPPLLRRRQAAAGQRVSGQERACVGSAAAAGPAAAGGRPARRRR